MKRVWIAWLLACLVVPFGAYVRLSQSGLGCPDWPGCFGQWTPQRAQAQIEHAVSIDPDGPVSPDKAWHEMAHRYLAGSLVMSVVAIGIRRRRQGALLLGGLMLQAALGMLTVTRLLAPAMVSAHLLVGMLLAAALSGLAWRTQLPGLPAPPALRTGCWLLFGLLLIQILLGGWVSSNHAALACAGFPVCNGSWWPPLQFRDAFAGGRMVPASGLVTIQWLHRLGALLVSCSVWALLARGWPISRLRPGLICLALAWGLQVSLGAANVLLGLPLPLAVLHNAGAMALLSVTLVLALRLTRNEP